MVAAGLSMSEKTEDPFDTNYVINLLENEKRLKNTIRDIESSLVNANKREDIAREQLEQTRLLISKSEQKFQACEVEKIGILNDAKLVANNTNSADLRQCQLQSIELSAAQNRLQTLEQQLSKTGEEYTKTQEELIRVKQLLTQAQDQNNIELESLRLQVAELQQSLIEPISIQTNYLSARYCSKPKFASVICVQEFLVRPSFTKVPITRLGIQVVDAKRNVVAEGEFNSAQSQLYRLTMGRGQEVPSGEYRAIYKVDNQTLRSESVVLSQ